MNFCKFDDASYSIFQKEINQLDKVIIIMCENKPLLASLIAMQDLKYRDFHSRLIPTIDKNYIIGVRTPKLRKFAADLSQTPAAIEFLRILPHEYYEENNVHAFLIERFDDYAACISALDVFLPYVDNWATCDSIRPKIFRNHLPELLVKIKEWIKSEHPFVIRFGIGMLMTFYLDEQFNSEHLDIVSTLRSDEYYVNMMIAWYFSTALAKKYNFALPYVQEQKLDKWTHNKAIQKSMESSRVGAEHKSYLKTLKIL